MQTTEIFNERVNEYAQFRPTYPKECIQFMQDEFSISPQTVIADIGSGTGILTDLLLNTGATVLAVEPNDQMRAAAEKQLGGNPKFISIKGTGESTNLANHSVNLITVAQAFHWIDEEKATVEFNRILKPQGRTALLWNILKPDTPFIQQYEAIKEKYGKDYVAIRKSHEPDLENFFKPKKHRIKKFPHRKLLDRDGLTGLIQSSSFMPRPNDKTFPEMIEEINSLYERFKENNLIRLNYETYFHYA